MERKPGTPLLADIWAAERGRASTTERDLYASVVFSAAALGAGVFFACAQWHDAWASLTLEELARKGHEPLAAQYPWLSAIVAALMVLILGRLYLFMRRLESR